MLQFARADIASATRQSYGTRDRRVLVQRKVRMVQKFQTHRIDLAIHRFSQTFADTARQSAGRCERMCALALVFFAVSNSRAVKVATDIAGDSDSPLGAGADDDANAAGFPQPDGISGLFLRGRQ